MKFNKSLTLLIFLFLVMTRTVGAKPFIFSIIPSDKVKLIEWQLDMTFDDIYSQLGLNTGGGVTPGNYYDISVTTATKALNGGVTHVSAGSAIAVSNGGLGDTRIDFKPSTSTLYNMMVKTAFGLQDARNYSMPASTMTLAELVFADGTVMKSTSSFGGGGGGVQLSDTNTWTAPQTIGGGQEFVATGLIEAQAGIATNSLSLYTGDRISIPALDYGNSPLIISPDASTSNDNYSIAIGRGFTGYPLTPGEVCIGISVGGCSEWTREYNIIYGNSIPEFSSGYMPSIKRIVAMGRNALMLGSGDPSDDVAVFGSFSLDSYSAHGWGGYHRVSAIGNYIMDNASQQAVDSCFMGYKVAYNTANSGVLSNSVAIGNYAGYSGLGNGSVVIGFKAGYSGVANNRLVIANSDTSTPLVAGEFDTGKFKVNGTLATSVRTSTYTYTATLFDSFIRGDATGGAITITLPTAVGNTGVEMTVKKIDSSANKVTVACYGAETMDGASTKDLAVQYDLVTVISNGTYWDVK